MYQDLLQRGNRGSTVTLHSLYGGILGQQSIIGSTARATGYDYIRIKRADLLDVLLEAARKADIPIHYGKRLIKITESADKVTALFDDGTSDTADLLFGCDGIHSAVRKLYVDPAQEPRYTGFAGIGGIIPATRLDKETVRGMDGLNAMFTQRGMLAAMPCTNTKEEIMWFFSKQTPIPEAGDTRDGWDLQRAEEIAHCQEEIMKMIGSGKGQWVDIMRTIVQATDSIRFYPVFQLATGCKWHAGRCILLGDAAHAMSPSAGQGVSMAMEDVFLITRILSNATSDFSDAYETFDRIRRPRVEEIARIAVKNSNMRKPTGSVVLKLKEWLLWGYLHASDWLNLSWTSEQLLVYDIDEVPL